MPGVKQEEIDWTGLDVWLEEKKGARVTKAEILEFLRENEVQAQEVTKGGQPLFQLPRADPEARVPVLPVDPKFQSAGDFKATRRAAQAWARENIRGSFRNIATGWEINVDRRGIESATSVTRSARDLDILQIIPDLLRDAVLVDTQAPRVAEIAVRAYHTLVGAMSYQGSIYRVQLTVREQDDGRRFYDQHSFEMGSPDLESEARGAEALDGPRLTSAPGPTISIGELLAGINREDGTPLLRLPGQMEQIAQPPTWSKSVAIYWTRSRNRGLPTRAKPESPGRKLWAVYTRAA